MATISDEIKTFFLGDTTGLEKAVDRGTRALDKQLKKERELQKAQNAPMQAKTATDRRAQAEIKAARDTAAKIAREREASSASNITKELRGNFGKNAKEKISRGLQSTLGLSEDAAAGVATKLGRFAPYLTAAGVAGGLLVKTFREANRFAGEQAEKMTAVREEMRQTAAINIYSSSAEGADSLSDKISAIRAEIEKSRGSLQENDEFGFGPGVIAGMKTAASKAQLALKSAVGLGPYNNFDQQEDAAKILQAQQKVSEQQAIGLIAKRSDAIKRELDMTRAKLTLDRQDVAINDLQLQKEREMASAAYRSLPAKDQENVKAKYDEQMTVQKELQRVMQDRYDTSSDILNLQTSSLTSEQQSVAAAERRVDLARRELDIHKSKTVEEARSNALAEQGDRNTVRNAQREAEMESPRKQQQRLYKQQLQENKNRKADALIDRNDGLRNIVRDKDGEILGGTDMVTGERRSVSESYLKRASLRTGLQTGSLSSGNLRAEFAPKTAFPGKRPSDSASAGRAAVQVATLQLGAIGQTNALLKRLVDAQGGRKLA